MSISSKAELTTALARALRRPGDPIVANMASDMILLAETGIIYGIKPTPQRQVQASPVRLRFMETRLDNFEVLEEYTNLPDGFLEFRTAPKVATDPVTKVQMISPEHMDSIRAGSETYSANGDLFACIQANQLRLRPAPAASLLLDITFYKLDRLAGDDSSNSLLLNAPNVYLYAAAREAAWTLGLGSPSAADFHDMYVGAVNAVISSDEAGRWSAGLPVMRVLGPTP